MKNDKTSRAEKILISIIEGTSYIAKPLSKLEELFLRLKNGVGNVVISSTASEVEKILHAIIYKIGYFDEPKSRIEEILLSILYNTDYAKEPKTELERLLLLIKYSGIWGGGVTIDDSAILGTCRLGIMKIGKGM